MKKINKRNLFLLLFMVLMVAFTSSCSKHTQQASITINDPYGLLHKDLKDSLAVQHPILPTRIEAIKEFEEFKKNPGQYKRYASFSELLDEVKADA